MDFGPTRPNTTSNRLYPKSGMIPRYTGYLPRKIYSFQENRLHIKTFLSHLRT